MQTVFYHDLGKENPHCLISKVVTATSSAMGSYHEDMWNSCMWTLYLHGWVSVNYIISISFNCKKINQCSHVAAIGSVCSTWSWIMTCTYFLVSGTSFIKKAYDFTEYQKLFLRTVFYHRFFHVHWKKLVSTGQREVKEVLHLYQ